MILINNRNYLRLQNRPLLNKMNEIEEHLDEQKVIVEASKKDVPTLKVNTDGKIQYIHSKYDPIAEAKHLVEQQQDIESYDHVLFIGAGLGYHIKMFTEQYPNLKISIYEPNSEVLYHFFTVQDLTKLKDNNIGKIFTATTKYEVESFIETYGKNILFFTLPVYEKLYQKEVQTLLETFKNNLKEIRSSIATNASFQKRWTINSIKNFPTVLRTPNILHDIDKKAFEGKPAIIVAAGPSLSEEFENLRYIKENGLAYIFSVGSAINALIEQGIYPDAACTYDPQSHNYKVIQILKDRNIENVPLIFGSSVGYETLENYPGPMLHTLISQDTISPPLLKHNQTEQIAMTNDAPSIAVVTFQLLCSLNVSRIILVGQNLSYRDNKLYAEGIQYDHVKTSFTVEEMDKMSLVNDVDGNLVRTNDGFKSMKKQFELYISSYPQIEVINTTKGGAMIEGTTFIPLVDVINTRLIDKIVKKDWYNAQSDYRFDYTKKQLQKLLLNMNQCNQLLENTIKELSNIENNVSKLQSSHLEKNFVKFDKEFAKLRKNLFYQVFISPMIRVQSELLVERSKYIKFEKDLLKRGKAVIDTFGSFLADCHAHLSFVQPYVNELEDKIKKEQENLEE